MNGGIFNKNLNNSQFLQKYTEHGDTKNKVSNQSKEKTLEDSMTGPNITIAQKIVEEVLNVKVKQINRFKTGLCHHVYDVCLDNGEKVVIRMSSEKTLSLLQGGVYWSEQLKKEGIPLPDIIDYNFHAEFPYVIMERLPGKDLGYVYDEMTVEEKMMLSTEIVNIQKTVTRMPKAHGYGYAVSYNDPILTENKSWKDVIIKSLKRSKKRIEETGICSTKPIELLFTRIERYNDYFERRKPVPFLDDLTTKNVIIHEGKLSGIVDVDTICFGDKVFQFALTKMALLSQQSKTDYIDYLAHVYHLSDEQLEVLDFYTAVCCVDFMSEIGMQFNKDETSKIDQERIDFLERIFYDLQPEANVLKTDLMRYGESCTDFINEQIITDLVRVVKKGKEAVVVCCKAHPKMNSQFMAVKLYREKKFRNFKKDAIYHQGRIWDKRLERGKKKGSSIVDQVEREVWVNNEFEALQTLYELGLNVPEPIACTEDAVVMSFIGEGEISAPLLKEIRLKAEEAEELIEKILTYIGIMLRNHIVHGDLSPFNILYYQGEPYLIDFPQAVDPNINYNAFELLYRDVENICNYVQKFGIEKDPYEISKNMWEPIYGPVS